MDILRKNTTPTFQIVPRRKLLLTEALRIDLRNENNDLREIIDCTIVNLPNENYSLTLATFPVGNLDAKFSYSLYINGTNEIVLMGKLMIITETQNVQDYTVQTNTKFYL